ncbi:StAR-related lipid transfer protein 7, mitochondrial-like protein [Drosera capensis]
MAVLSVLVDVLGRPSLWEVMMELSKLMFPLWVAVFVGVVVGWAWKPKWISNFPITSSSSLSTSSSGAGGVGVRGFSDSKQVGSHLGTSLLRKGEEERSELVDEADFRHLWQLIEVKDGGPAWIQMMDRSTPTMSYQAWRRDPQTGPPQYRSRTVYDDVTPEMVRDFFWDNEFRSKWDDMLLFHETLEESRTTGVMMVHWVRKFPFFCSDREYVIGRRIWVSQGAYYCVTTGVPCNSVPRHTKPRRVDLYYSSWCIRAVESRKGDGKKSACEVMLFHHEDMGIPWEIAKLGVRQGMWGAVQKIEPGLRAYQKERASGAPLSRSALMAQVNTKVSDDYLKALETDDSELQLAEASPGKRSGMNIPKLLVVGGAVALACTLDQGLLTKAVIFGVARKFWVRMGRD